MHRPVYFRILLAHGVLGFCALSLISACGADDAKSRNAPTAAGSSGSSGGAPSAGGTDVAPQGGSSIAGADAGGAGSTDCDSAFSCKRTVLVSGWPGAVDPDSFGFMPDISRDGRFIAFVSTDPIAGDRGDAPYGVFLADRAKQTITRVSETSSGARPNEESAGASISSDGRYVVFESLASDLVDGDTNEEMDVFIRDTQSGIIRRINLNSDGQQTDGRTRAARVNSDGRFVVFESWATNLPGGDGTRRQIYVRDLQDGATTRVSVALHDAVPDQPSLAPDISDDGQRVVFESYAKNLVENDTNGEADVFVHDRGGETRRVNVSTSGAQGNGWSGSARISGNGRYVVFESAASNLVPGDTNGVRDVFVHDLETGETARVNTADGGVQSPIAAQAPSISDDGRFIAYQRTNQPYNDPGAVCVVDRTEKTTTVVSVTPEGTRLLRLWTELPAISGDGQWVTYEAMHLDANREPFGSKTYQVFVSRTAGVNAGTEPPTIPKSCLEIRNANPTARSGGYIADVDGAGPLPEIILHCDMETAGGGWTILYATSGEDGFPPITSDLVGYNAPFDFLGYNQPRTIKVALSKLATETLFLRLEHGDSGADTRYHHLIANHPPFSELLLEPNRSEDFEVKLTADDGTQADAFMGYSNYRISGGGDFSLSMKTTAATCFGSTALGVDHHSQMGWQLNCGCNYQFLYSNSAANLDGDAGYDVHTELGSWKPTQATCDSAEGGKLAFRVAVR